MENSNEAKQLEDSLIVPDIHGDSYAIKGSSSCTKSSTVDDHPTASGNELTETVGNTNADNMKIGISMNESSASSFACNYLSTSLDSSKWSNLNSFNIKPTTTSPQPSSTLCWSCKKEKAKYKCPGCSTITCSVPCVKHHKQVMKCNGKRKKTEYVAKENFKESHFMSDYRLLEEVNGCICSNSRNKLPHPYKTTWMKAQVKKAASMNIRLLQLPKSFKRRKENSTFYNFKSQRFLWHIEWVFTNCKLIIPEKRFPDSTALLEGATKFTLAEVGNDFYDPRLNEYSGKNDLNFYMKKEEMPANNVKYFMLDGSKGLRENLRDKTIIEYPRVFVALSGQSDVFERSIVA